MLRAAGDPWGQWQPTAGAAEVPAQAGVGLWLRGGGTAPAWSDRRRRVASGR